MTNTAWAGTIGAPYINTDALFQAWGNSISAAMSAIGCVQIEAQLTAGGTFSWGTVAHSAAPLTEKCYEVWRLGNATTHAQRPIFIRFGYGSGAAIYYPNLTMQVGTTWTSGGTVGGLGAAVGKQITLPTSYSADGGGLGSWAAADGDGFVMSLYPASPGIMHSVIWVDRLRDPNTGSVLLYGSLPVGAQVGITNGSYPSLIHIDHQQSEAISRQSQYPPVLTTGALSTTALKLNALNQSQLYPWWSTIRSGHGVTKMVATVNQADMTAGSTPTVGWLPTTTVRVVKALGAYPPAATACDASASAGGSLVTWWHD